MVEEEEEEEEEGGAGGAVVRISGWRRQPCPGAQKAETFWAMWSREAWRMTRGEGRERPRQAQGAGSQDVEGRY